MTDTVTVKPLVWDTNHASTEIGLYAHYTGFTHKDGDTVVQLNEKIIGHARDPEAAKAAAQADYERRIRSALEPQTPAQAARVLRNIEPDDGFWRSCSGCHETVDGQETGWYPYSPVFKCHLGAGCRECGGLGAVWDDTDYEDMARAIAGGE